MPSQLDNLVSIGKLKVEPAARSELDGYLRSGAARIGDAENRSLSVESRFDLAYSAAHAFAIAALRFHGYRSESRFLVFQTLQHTVSLPPEKWRVLEHAHRLRNQAEYEGGVDVEISIIEGVILIARELEQLVIGLRRDDAGR